MVGLEATLPVMIRFCQMTSDYNKYRSIISEVEWSETEQEVRLGFINLFLMHVFVQQMLLDGCRRAVMAFVICQ